MEDKQTSRDGDFSPGHSERSDSPESSCVSMKSDQSMEQPGELKGEHASTDLGDKSNQREPSSVSMKSDMSMERPEKLEDTHKSTHLSDKSNQREPSSVSMKSDMSMEQPGKLEDRHKSTHLSQKSNSPGSSCVSMKSDQSVDTSKTFKGRHTSIDLSTFRLNLVKKFECLYEGTSKQGNTTLLNEIYTELYITESESGEINNEHEVRQIETQSRRAATEDTPITCNEIFRPLPGQDKAIRTVLTKGVAGIGKTVSVQKFIVDWAEGKENQDVQLIFPLPFREINLMKDRTLSLSDLLHVFYPVTKEMDISSDEYKVLFIFDGLDECRLSLDFQSNVRICDV
uniref:NACHT domain-containing protein n=1 Tax=Cyprinus carpio carpio TaxID=630221 RepID=A0A9J8CST4_CYPCA